MQMVTRCAGWSIKEVDPPAMDWSRFPKQGQPPINTSFPILFVSTSNDPVTPLHQALTMSQRFAGAGLIEQLSDGHCSVSAVSLCSLARIKAYFHHGIVPKPPQIDPKSSSGGDATTGEWERCQADEGPWKPFQPQAWLNEAGDCLRTEENMRMMEAWQEVQHGFRRMHTKEAFFRLPNGLQEILRMDYETAVELLDFARAEK